MAKKMLSLLVLSFVIIFLVMVFSSSSGYYEYELNKKTALTEKSIEEFESDLKKGKKIDIKDYLVDESKDYNNNFSKTGRNISSKINSVFSKSIAFIFNSIGSMVEK